MNLNKYMDKVKNERKNIKIKFIVIFLIIGKLEKLNKMKIDFFTEQIYKI